MDNRMWLVHQPTGTGVFLGKDYKGHWQHSLPNEEIGAELEEFYSYLDTVDQRYHLILVQELTHKWDDLGAIEHSDLRVFKNLRENEHRHMMVPPPQKKNLIPVTIHFNSDGSLYHQLMVSVPNIGETILLPSPSISSKLVKAKVIDLIHYFTDTAHVIKVHCSQVD